MWILLIGFSTTMSLLEAGAWLMLRGRLHAAVWGIGVARALLLALWYLSSLPLWRGTHSQVLVNAHIVIFPLLLAVASFSGAWLALAIYSERLPWQRRQSTRRRWSRSDWPPLR